MRHYAVAIINIQQWISYTTYAGKIIIDYWNYLNVI